MTSMPIPSSPVRFRQHAVALLLLLSLSCGAVRGESFLLPEQAFRFSARPIDERSVEIGFDVAPGYYLYRTQFSFAAPDAVLGAVRVPQGVVKFDETFQKDVETHRGRVRIVLPVKLASQTFKLFVQSQGCADKGLCYPPDMHTVEVRLRGFGGDGTVRAVPGP